MASERLETLLLFVGDQKPDVLGVNNLKDYFWSRPAKPVKKGGRERSSSSRAAMARVSQLPPLRVGARVAIAKTLQPRSSSHAFVIVSASSCDFCRQSGPFQKRLFEEAKSKSVPVMLALPEGNREKQFAASLGLPNVPIADWESLALKPMATPGLLLVDSKGTILKIWLGLLNQSGEAEVMNAIAHPSEVSNPPRKLPSGEAMISGADVQTLAKTEAMNILNVNERQMFRAMQYHLKVSNIPLDELQLRAGRELRRSELQVVNCTDAPIMACVAALQRLDLQGFRALALDDAMGVLTEANRR